MRKFHQFTALFFVLIFAFTSLKAQDIITLKTGEDIKSKIMEIGLSDVKYKKFENLSGPTYTMNKSDIFMIKYENGSKDVFGNTSPAAKPDQSNNEYNSNNNNNSYNNNNSVRKQVEEEYRNTDAQREYDKNMKLYHKKLVKGIVITSIGVPMLFAGAGLLGYGVSAFNADEAYNSTLSYGSSYYAIDETGDIVCMALGAAFMAVGIPLSIVGPVTLARSFHYKGLAKKAQASMSFAPVLAPAPGSHTNFASGMGMKIVF